MKTNMLRNIKHKHILLFIIISEFMKYKHIY